MSKDAYTRFEESTLDIFSFLTDYEFELAEVHVHPPECAISYRSSMTLFLIDHEVGDGVWFSVAQLKEDGKFTFLDSRFDFWYDLGKLIKRISPQRRRFIEPRYIPLLRTSGSVRKNLEAYADFLKSEGESILRGDLSIFKLEDRRGEIA